MSVQDAYIAALRYASLKHKGQLVPGTEFPYIVHVVNVAMEVIIACSNTPETDTEFAVSLALLHDVLEDTKVTYEEINKMFGERIAEGILALTKFSSLEKSNQIRDSIDRIKLLEKEVGMVKLADRIANLDAPAADWEQNKRERYKKDAQLIVENLAYASEYLAQRLRSKIDGYQTYVDTGFKQ